MPSFVLQLEISFSKKLLLDRKGVPGMEPGSPKALDRRLNAAISIRNAVKHEALKRLHKLQHDREYQAVQTEFAARKKVNPDADTSDLAPIYAACYNRYGYSEYDLHKYVLPAKYQYSNILGADECQKLATQAFNAVDKIRTHESKKITYKPRTADTSVEGKSSKSTLKYIGDWCIQFGRGNVYPLIVKKNDAYALKALKHKVKYVRLLRKTIRGEHRYYAQLVLDGIPPRTKNLKYGRSDSRVGLDEGTTTLAIASNKEVSLVELAPGTTANEKKLRRINRAIDRSKRATNPDNYNENGTIKKGRLSWNKSKRYLRLEAKRKELYRKNARNRECSHNALANHVVSLGTDIRVEQMRIAALAKRSSKTTTNKQNGRIRSKKRYGKTVLNRAPAYIISAIDRKLQYVGRSIKKVDTFQVRASQYDHRSDTYKKKELSARWHVFSDETKVQRDIYSAFLICNTNDALNQVDRKACIRGYKNFKILHDKEIVRLNTENNNTLRWYIA